MTETITPEPAALQSLEGIDPGVIPERPCSELFSDTCPQRQMCIRDSLSGSGPTLGGAYWGCGAGARTGPASVRHRWAVEP